MLDRRPAAAAARRPGRPRRPGACWRTGRRRTAPRPVRRASSRTEPSPRPVQDPLADGGPRRGRPAPGRRPSARSGPRRWRPPRPCGPASVDARGSSGRRRPAGRSRGRGRTPRRRACRAGAVGRAADLQVGDDRAALLRQAGLVEAAHVPAGEQPRRSRGSATTVTTPVPPTPGEPDRRTRRRSTTGRGAGQLVRRDAAAGRPAPAGEPGHDGQERRAVAVQAE